MEKILKDVIEYIYSNPLQFWIGSLLIFITSFYMIRKMRRRLRNQILEAKKYKDMWARLDKDLEIDLKTNTTRKKNLKKSTPTARVPRLKDEARYVEYPTKPIPNPKSTVSTESKKEVIKEKVEEPKTSYTETLSKPELEVSTKKSHPQETLPQAKVETPKSEEQISLVNYTSSLNDQKDSYPILRIPKKGTVVRSFRYISTKRRGYKEESFQRAIENHFREDFIVSGNMRINTGKDTRPFEPDIALIGKKNKSLRIDIEIDEPYAGITRKATHCIGEDTMRDIYFTDRGWLVVRFSEYQVHTSEKRCLRKLADIIKSVNPSYHIPSSLMSYDSIANEKLWDILQAQKWEKERYRENYLNHEFQVLAEQVETDERGLNEQELKEESMVESTPIGVADTKLSIGFNLLNEHPRDKRIEFYPEPHIYTIDNTPAPSVSTIISKFFPEFDAHHAASRLNPRHEYYGLDVSEIVKIWKENGEEAAIKGTNLHEQIENYLLGLNYENTEDFHFFQQFIDDHSDINPYRSEWRIFDDEHHIAGTIDLLSKNGNSYEIFDWKRSKKVVDSIGNPITENNWQRGIGELRDIDDTSYNRYCIQQSIYKYILEKNYNISVSRMNLVVMYPAHDTYYKLEVPYLENKAEYILSTL